MSTDPASPVFLGHDRRLVVGFLALCAVGALEGDPWYALLLALTAGVAGTVLGIAA